MDKINSRRRFIKNSFLFGVGLPLLSNQLYGCIAPNNSKKLNILILGGTSFLGPHQIAYAISRGHSITTFTRGRTKPTIHTDIFNNVEQLIGDRENNLSALENRHWDVVIDNSGRKTAWTEKIANLLKEKSGIYIYISSTGVYFPYKHGDIKESSKVLLKTPEEVTDQGLKMNYDYGVMKATSELEAIKAFGKERTIVVRPTYMFGPGDLTNRFIHWPIRLTRGGEVLVPGKEDDPVQCIDVRDVAEWCIRLAENKAYGIYNAVGPSEPITMQNFVKEAASTFNTTNELVYVTDYNFLKKNDVYYIVPWIMQDDYSYGSARVNTDKAKKNGLIYRELKISIRDTYDWWYSDALTNEMRHKFEGNPSTVFAREKEILKKWNTFLKNK
jgi:2'-hydroxyisoflavone reductase